MERINITHQLGRWRVVSGKCWAAPNDARGQRAVMLGFKKKKKQNQKMCPLHNTATPFARKQERAREIILVLCPGSELRSRNRKVKLGPMR